MVIGIERGVDHALKLYSISVNLCKISDAMSDTPLIL